MRDESTDHSGAPTSEARRQALMDFALSQTSAVFYIADLDDARPIRYISENIETITGHQPDAFLQEARYGFRHIHPDDRDAYDQGLARLARDGVATHEYRFQTTSGEFRWFRDELRVIDRPGDVAEFAGCMVDVTAEKEAHERLRNTEALQAAIIEVAEGATIAISEANEILEFNFDAEEMFGHTREAVVGRSITDVVITEAHHGAFAKCLEQFGVCCDRPAKQCMRIEARHADGRTFPAEINITQTQVAERAIFVISVVDITERLAVEEERERLAQLLQDAVASLPNGFAIFGADDRLIQANDAMTQPFGLEASSLVGSTRHDIIRRILPKIRSLGGRAVDDNEEQAAQIAERLRTAKIESTEVELVDGAWRLLSRRPTSEGGQVLIATDVTRLKQAEAAMRESEEHFRMLVESYPLAVWMVDVKTGKLQYESPSAATLTGREWSPDGPANVGAHYADPEKRERFVDALREGRELKNYEIEFRRADGSTVWVAATSKPVDHQGRDVQIVGLVDLTEQHAREKELRQARETLQDAIESLSEGFILYDADDRMVMCNSQYKAFHAGHEDIFVPGANWHDVTRERAKRGLFTNSRGREDDWLAEEFSKQGIALKEEFPFTGGRWFEYSHRPTRQGGFVSVWREITEQKNMEAALRKSEELIRHVVEGIPAPIAMTRASDGKIVYESPTSREAFDMPAADGEANAMQRYVHPERRQEFIAQLHERGSLDNYEIEFRRADGSQYIGAVSARVIEYGGEEMIVSTTVDITERERRESELRRARETLEDAIESLPEGFSLFDADDRLVMCNSRFREFNDLSADMLKPGVRWLDFIRAGAERGQYVDAMGHVEEWMADRHRLHSLGTGEPRGIEFQQHDGRWFYAFSQNTRQGGYVGIRTDITERKKMEQTLRDSEAMVRHVLEACPIPITMNRVNDGIIIYESPATRDLLKYEGPQEGKSVIGRWADPRDREAYLERMRRTGAVDRMEVRYLKADGEEFWCSLSARLIDYRGEDVLVSTLYDLTERNEVQAEMARQQEILHQTEKLSALGELLAGVSHELNNPLSVLVGQALMLKENAADEETAARAEKIGKAADRCARIVKAFLAMARQQPSHTVPVEMNNVIEGALEVTGYSLRTAGIDVSMRLAKELPAVMGDPDQLRQVLTNIIVNANHALESVDGPRRLRVVSSYRKKTEQVVIKVKDNGPGIPADIRTRIFEPLYTTKEIGSGTGIGLALCHRIVEAHGGTIVVEGSPHDGAVFAIRLPAAGAADREAEESEAGGDGEAACRVLVVDDESDVGQIISDVLQHHGHIVEIASSGQVAMEKVKRQDYDVILSDIRMPGMDGPTFYRALCEEKPQLVDTLAFITGDTLSPRVKAFLDSSQRPYLEKPVMPRDVRKLVARIVQQAAE